MDIDITPEKLIQLIYHELPPQECIMLLEKLSQDDELYATYTELKEQTHLLSHVQESPSNTSVQIILEESCSSSPMEMI
jgi:hypothetical protein